MHLLFSLITQLTQMTQALTVIHRRYLKTTDSVVILLWNANGITNRKTEPNILLHDKRIDVALITTVLTQASHSHITLFAEAIILTQLLKIAQFFYCTIF